MHKDFYASGFLYHSPTDQILLQQLTSSQWALFGGERLEEEDPEALLKGVIFNLLEMEVSVVHPVYSYFNEAMNRDQYIGYSIVRRLQGFPSRDGLKFNWFSFGEVQKLQASMQVKHDIVVGQRVIKAALRKRRGQLTLQ